MLKIIQKLFRYFLEPFDQWAYRKFYNFPLGNSPRSSSGKYLEIWNKAKCKEYPIIDQFEDKSGYCIDDNWFHELALLTQIVIKKSDICYQHGRLLYSVLSAYISKKNFDNFTIFETGTARGFSSLCMAKALKDLQQHGKILTFDILPHDSKMYWNCIADEKGPMTRSKLLHNYSSLIEEFIVFIQGDSKLQLKKVVTPRIHLAFLDGAHTYEYVQNEFNLIKEKQKKGDVIFFDDYSPHFFPGIVKAVDEICKTHNYSKEIIILSEQRGYAIAKKK